MYVNRYTEMNKEIAYIYMYTERERDMHCCYSCYSWHLACIVGGLESRCIVSRAQFPSFQGICKINMDIRY